MYMNGHPSARPPRFPVRDMVDDAIHTILSSRYIVGNRSYVKKVGNVKFVYSKEPIANSFASIEKDGSYCVYTFAGLSTLMCACAAIFSIYTMTHKVGRAKRALNWLFENAIGELELHREVWEAVEADALADFYGKFPEYTGKDKYPQTVELARKMIASVIGHEIGHIVLGHCDRSGGTANNVSRNDERSADLFSCSIMQGTGFGGSFVDGEVFMQIALYFMCEKSQRNLQYGTHPGAKDRVMNIVQSFENELRYSSIGLSDILRLIR